MFSNFLLQLNGKTKTRLFSTLDPETEEQIKLAKNKIPWWSGRSHLELRKIGQFIICQNSWIDLKASSISFNLIQGFRRLDARHLYRGQFLESPRKKAIAKSRATLFTYLYPIFYLYNTNRGSLHVRRFRRIHPVFRYRWTKSDFRGPKNFRGFGKKAPGIRWSSDQTSRQEKHGQSVLK